MSDWKSKKQQTILLHKTILLLLYHIKQLYRQNLDLKVRLKYLLRTTQSMSCQIFWESHFLNRNCLYTNDFIAMIKQRTEVFPHNILATDHQHLCNITASHRCASILLLKDRVCSAGHKSHLSLPQWCIQTHNINLPGTHHVMCPYKRYDTIKHSHWLSE